MSLFSANYTLEEVPQVVTKLRERFPAATFFTLEGELGAGKTTLITEFCRQIGVADDTSSPTFAIVNEYDGPRGPVYHLDAYRLRDLDEALAIGVEEYFDRGTFVFVEWPAVIEPLLPSDVVHLRLSHRSSSDDIPFRELTATQATP